jgi:site-specific DNA-cytosine methylase
MSLCDGMGGYALSLKANQIKATHYYASELDATARIICDNANPADATFPGVDHSTLPCDVNDITEDTIRALGFNVIKSFVAGPPCQDMSKLRLLPGYRKKKGQNTQPGLKGKHGQVFIQVLQIFAWVMKYNPDLRFWVLENLDFSDLTEDWEVICSALGDPYVLDSADFSCQRRVRA